MKKYFSFIMICLYILGVIGGLGWDCRWCVCCRLYGMGQSSGVLSQFNGLTGRWR